MFHIKYINLQGISNLIGSFQIEDRVSRRDGCDDDGYRALHFAVWLLYDKKLIQKQQEHSLLYGICFDNREACLLQRRYDMI